MTIYYFYGREGHPPFDLPRLTDDTAPGEGIAVVTDKASAVAELSSRGFADIYITDGEDDPSLYMYRGFRGVFGTSATVRASAVPPSPNMQGLSTLLSTDGEHTVISLCPDNATALDRILTPEEAEGVDADLRHVLKRALRDRSYSAAVACSHELCAVVQGRVDAVALSSAIAEIEHMKEGVLLRAGLCYTREGESLASALSGARIAREQLGSSFYNRVSVCNRPMSEEIRERQIISSAASAALLSGEFYVLYQPVADRRGEFVGCEALVRWARSGGDVYSPSQFVPIFEDNGFIVELDLFVCERVAALQEKIAGKGYTPLPVSVNLSGCHSLDTGFFRKLTSLEHRHPRGMRSVNFEISAAHRHYADHELKTLIDSLHSRGYRVYMDDFGNSYSGISTLAVLPVDGIKLDMAVTRDVERTERARSIVTSLIELAHGAGLTVSAKGGDTESLCGLLCDAGIDELQGYHYSRPLTERGIVELLYEGGKGVAHPAASAAAPTDFPDDSSLLEALFDSVYYFTSFDSTPRRLLCRDSFLSLPINPSDYSSLMDCLLGYVSADSLPEYKLCSALPYLESFLSCELRTCSFEVDADISGKRESLRISLIKPEGSTGRDYYLCLKLGNADSVHRERGFGGERDKLDPHTSLYTRRYFLANLHGIINNTPENRDLALYLFNIDSLSSINEAFGSLMGDEIITRFSGLLSSFFPADSVIGRMSGDEFALIVHGVRDRIHAYRYAERFSEVLANKPLCEGVPVSCRIGVACLSDTSRDPGSLYTAARRVLPKGAGEVAIYNK